jgi:peroxiredoxin (alkyl hydroperoxide reductase subunit C)
MHACDGNGRGPALGEQAPFIEALSSKKSQKSDGSRGGWIILISHPHDLLPLLRTRTFNYILCKRRTRIVMLGNGSPESGIADGNFLKKYIIRHNAAFLDDPDYTISAGYGLVKDHADEEVKGVFVIDPRGFLRMKLYFDVTHPRNFYEILKLLDALQEADSQRKRRPTSDVWKRRLSIVSRSGTMPEEG